MASLSWGKGESSAWLPWLRNCDEPWERFCFCALRTDFRVKPSTFSEAEMAALAAPAGGGGGGDDDDDISAALAPGSSGYCLHRAGPRRRRHEEEEAGERRGELAALRPGPPGQTAVRLPGAAELLLAARQRLTATSQRRRLLVPAARRAPGLKKLLTPGAEGGWKGEQPEV